MIARRDFLKLPLLLGGACAGLRSGNALAAFPDYKALVCIFLHGGNDSFNMVVPCDTVPYNEYAAARANMKVPLTDLHHAELSDSQGAKYLLHKKMPYLGGLVADGKLAVVANVGPRQAIIDPVDGGIPRLFSHNDQQTQWMTLRGQSGLATGWAGRAADRWSDISPLNYSVSGNSALQIGRFSKPYIMSQLNGVAPFTDIKPDAAWLVEKSRRQAIDTALANADSSATRYYAAALQRALRLSASHLSALATDTSSFLSLFPSNDLNALRRQMKYVAQVINGRAVLGASRQVFYVSLGGFDTHDNQLTNHPLLLEQLDQSIEALHRACLAMGVENNVTMLTASEFGRTLTSNGDGTDHGWGGHQLVVGGGVKGGSIYGKMPSYIIGGADDFGFGRIKPGLSVEQYVADALRWFGFNEQELVDILPQLGDFSERSLGYMTV